MKKLAFLLLFAPIAVSANPIAVGDDVFVSYDYPNIGSAVCPGPAVTVADDSSDAIDILGCADFFSWVVDMNTSGFTSLLTPEFGAIFDPVADFDGIVVSGIDWVAGTPHVASVSTNLPGWSDELASISENSMSFSFGSLPSIPSSASGDYFFDVTLVSVPEPSTIVLFGLGLAGIGLVRRRKRV